MRRPVLPPFPAGEGGSAPHLAVTGGEDVGAETDIIIDNHTGLEDLYLLINL